MRLTALLQNAQIATSSLVGFPFDVTKPFSSVKTACRPLPRSSMPRSPRRLPGLHQRPLPSCLVTRVFTGRALRPVSRIARFSRNCGHDEGSARASRNALVTRCDAFHDLWDSALWSARRTVDAYGRVSQWTDR